MQLYGLHIKKDIQSQDHLHQLDGLAGSTGSLWRSK